MLPDLMTTFTPLLEMKIASFSKNSFDFADFLRQL